MNLAESYSVEGNTATLTPFLNQSHNRPLASWFYIQRKHYRDGTLEPIKEKVLSLLHASWHQVEDRRRKKRRIAAESIEEAAPPADLNNAAQCLMKMSRISLSDLTTDDEEEQDEKEEEQDEKEEEQDTITTTTVDLDSIKLAFCQACNKNRAAQYHHKLCPKSIIFKPTKLEKIVLGANVGCSVCARELEFGCHRGRHAKHSARCSRSKDYKPDKTSRKLANQCRPTSPATVADAPKQKAPTNSKKTLPTKKRPLPESLFLPHLVAVVVASPAICFRPHEISPLITVDTFDLDALIRDLEDGKVDGNEALERLQMIRRLAL